MLLLLPSVGGRHVIGPLLMFTFMGVGAAELTLVQEGGPGSPTWGYSLLPSTFPLTWDEARAACEAVPGSMLARVEGWEAEAAVEEYLKELAFSRPVWLANRQTLPEVLGNEEREMNHVGGVGEGVGLVADDLILGGDVGVTLRCAAYRVGVGVVHELCSAGTMTAALCLQRLSSGRPLSDGCPPSVHRQWLLVTRSAEPSATQEAPDDTTVSVVGLQPCHHQHRLGHTPCHPKSGWSHTACPSQTSSPKHHRNSRKTHRNHHHGRERARPSHRLASSNDVIEVNKRDKRMADTSERKSDSKERTESHKTDSTSSSRTSEMRVAPLAKAENLNLDLIESIMRDFSNSKKSKVENQDEAETDDRNPRMEDTVFEEDQMQVVGVTKKPDNRKTNSPEVMEGSEALQNHLNKDVTIDPNKRVGLTNKESSSTKNNEKFAETSDAYPSENTKDPIPNVNIPQKTDKEQGNREDGDQAASAATSDAHEGRQEQKQDTAGKTEVQAEVGAEEEMGPTFTVGVGPIFVEDPQKERAIIDAAKAERQVNETLPDELVVRILEQEQAREGRQQEETSEGKDGNTGERPIVFPEVPENARPDPTPRSDTNEGDSENVNSNVVSTGPPSEGNTDQTTTGRQPAGGDGPEPSSTSIPLIFPRDESEPQVTNAETKTESDTALKLPVTKDTQNNAEVTTQPTVPAGGGAITTADSLPTGQGATPGPPVTTTTSKPESTDLGEKFDMEKESDEEDTESPGMDEKAEKLDMDTQSDSDDKDNKEETDNVGGGSVNMDEKTMDEEYKEAVEEPDDTGTSGSEGPQDAGEGPPAQGNPASGQGTTGESDTDQQPKESGKQALLTQIFKGIFG